MIKCDKIPEEGRSGSGLFNKKGQLIGVLSARPKYPDVDGRYGIYSSWKEVIKLLKGTTYEFLLGPK